MLPFSKRTLIYLVLSTTLFVASCGKEKLHWQKVERLESYTTDRLNSIVFDGNTGFAVGGQRFYTTTILSTNDGGSTWAAKSYPDPGKALYGITQRYDSTLVAIGFDGKLAWTKDKQNWNFTQLAHWYSYKDIAYVEPGTGIAIGGISFNSGFIAYTDLNYKTYKLDSFAYELNDIQMVSNKLGYISGYGVVMKTTDNAVSWQILDVKDDNFTAIHALNENEAWTCGYNGSIYHTADGGKTWDKQRNGNNAFKSRHRLLDILFIDASRGWAVGEDGIVLYTGDGGNNWQPFEHFTDHTLRCIAPAPDGSLVVCGDNGSLYKLWL
jgi:photosystem II stability/assembly factor-like uncharacterized protein